MQYRPHDLLWLNSEPVFTQQTDWLHQHWSLALPVVVRRDWRDDGAIPVGIRGKGRGQRAAGWVMPEQVVGYLPPETLATPAHIANSPFARQAPLRAAAQLCQHNWPWVWGITGSSGFALATGQAVLHRDSDLDLLIRAPVAIPREQLFAWQQAVSQLACRADTQVETPCGGFSLNEWLRDGRVLLKTSTGPRNTQHPWQPVTGETF